MGWFFFGLVCGLCSGALLAGFCFVNIDPKPEPPPYQVNFRVGPVREQKEVK